MTAPSTSPTWWRRAPPAFKFSTFCTDPKRFPRIPPQTLYACFTAIGAHGLDRRRAQRERRSGARGDQGGRGIRHPRLSRARLVAPADHAKRWRWPRSMRSRPQAGCSWHVVHCSLGRGYDSVHGLSPAGLRHHHRGVHSLSHARRGERRRAPRRQGQDQSADPPARARSKRSGIISLPATSRWCRPIM